MTGSSEKQKKRSPLSANKEYYPVFLDITGKRCVIIGGGKIAERKCSALIRKGAKVAVISPKITRRLKDYRGKGFIRHIERNYRKGDIKSVFIVIVATDSEEINRKVVADAATHNVLLNVVDNPSLCNFIVPSVLIRGPLTIAVSTGGISPAMARSIRRELEGIYGNEFPKYLRFLKGIRMKATREIPDKRKRGQLLKDLASEEMIQMLIRKGFGETKKEAINRWQKSCISLS